MISDFSLDVGFSLLFPALTNPLDPWPYRCFIACGCRPRAIGGGAGRPEFVAPLSRFDDSDFPPRIRHTWSSATTSAPFGPLMAGTVHTSAGAFGTANPPPESRCIPFPLVSFD